MKLLTVEQTAETLATSRQTISRMIIEGALPAITLRAGKRKKVYRIREEVLERFLLANERQTAARFRSRREAEGAGDTNITTKKEGSEYHEQNGRQETQIAGS